MKKYKVSWGNWNSSAVEVPAMNIAQAIEVACKKHNIAVDRINEVKCLGDW